METTVELSEPRLTATSLGMVRGMEDRDVATQLDVWEGAMDMQDRGDKRLLRPTSKRVPFLPDAT